MKKYRIRISSDSLDGLRRLVRGLDVLPGTQGQPSRDCYVVDAIVGEAQLEKLGDAAEILGELGKRKAGNVPISKTNRFAEQLETLRRAKGD